MKFFKGLVSRVNLIFYLFFATSLLTLLVSTSVLYTTYKRGLVIKETIERVDFVEDIHNNIKRAHSLFHAYLLTHSPHLLPEIKTILTLIEEKVYKEREGGPETPQLTAILEGIQRIRDDITTPKPSIPHIIANEEALLSMIGYVGEMSNIYHQKIMAILEKDTQWMWFITAFYLAISITGFLLILAGQTIGRKRILQPILSLYNATRDFTRGDYGRRVEVTFNDEIGDVYRAFNEMAEGIEKRQKTCKELEENLEERVKERTERLEEAYVALVKAQERLISSERFTILGAFASRFTHIVVQPLNSLAINLTALKRLDTGNYHRILDVMDDEIKRMTRLVEEHSRFTRPFVLQKGPNYLEEVIDEAIISLTEKAETAEIRIERRYPPTLTLVPLDREQMREVFLNLGTNAIEAMDRGGTLTFEVSQDGGKAIIRVRDTGCGMDKERVKEIFTPFYSTKETGLGLGLPIVKHVVEGHGGEIDCESSPGEGTTFTVTLPLGG